MQILSLASILVMFLDHTRTAINLKFHVFSIEKRGAIKASHILVAFKGSERANPDITRTKEEAKKLAQDLY